MSLRIFDFECPKGHIREAMVEADVRAVQCHKCRRMAQRRIAAPRCKLEGVSGDFPTAADQWEKRRESHMAKERKHKERHGTYT